MKIKSLKISDFLMNWNQNINCINIVITLKLNIQLASEKWHGVDYTRGCTCN